MLAFSAVKLKAVRPLFRISFAVALALLSLLALSSEAKELRITNFQSNVVVTPDGKIDVTETIQARFIGTPWHGLYRTIPVEYVTPQGFNYTLFLDIRSITDGDGRKLKYESTRVRHYRKLKIYIPDADNSTQTIVIEYTVSDALRFFEDHDELYWNVTGDEWDVPIQAASAHILLPAATTNIRANVFTGAYGSRAQNADADVVGSGVDVATRAPLRYHEGLTVAVAFDKGFVHEPTAADKFMRFLRSNWPLIIPVIAFALMFNRWWTKGRDPRLRPIAPQYQPPDQLTPGEAGTLIDTSADMRDITATMVDLAVRGYIVIEEHQTDSMFGLMHHKDYNFILHKDRSQWTGLKSHERYLLEGLFSAETANETVSLSSLRNHFYTSIPAIKNGLLDSLVEHGYYNRRPDSVRAGYIGIGLVLGFVIAWGGAALAIHSGVAPLASIIAGILTAAIICGFGWFMPAHTEQGTRALEGVLGFEDFLVHVDSERFNRTIKTPEMFEKFLPFAMAFGVEKNWSKAFSGIMTQPPQWYRGSSYGANFYPIYFANDLGYMTSQASSVMTSAPRSSGGSGFSGGGGGGGFSGGGFGGGGGGGF
jgi:uncharacterized membrane protein YgcG